MEKIKINNTEYPVCFNLNALEEFEQLTNESLLTGKVRSNIKTIKYLLYIGLKYGADPTGKTEFEFSVEQIGTWVKSIKDESVIAVQRLYMESFGINPEELPNLKSPEA